MSNDVDYVLLSEKTLVNKEFLASSNYINSNETYTNNTYGTNAKEYATSDIRAYLKDTTALGFATTYGFTSDELALIKERTLQSLYTGDDNKTVPSNVSGYTPIDRSEDKFWALSKTEAVGIFEDSLVSNYYMSARATNLSDSHAGWWLRSPDPSHVPSAFLFDGSGYIRYQLSESHDRGHGDYGVRPACII